MTCAILRPMRLTAVLLALVSGGPIVAATTGTPANDIIADVGTFDDQVRYGPEWHYGEGPPVQRRLIIVLASLIACLVLSSRGHRLVVDGDTDATRATGWRLINVGWAIFGGALLLLATSSFPWSWGWLL